MFRIIVFFIILNFVFGLIKSRNEESRKKPSQKEEIEKLKERKLLDEKDSTKESEKSQDSWGYQKLQDIVGEIESQAKEAMVQGQPKKKQAQTSQLSRDKRIVDLEEKLMAVERELGQVKKDVYKLQGHKPIGEEVSPYEILPLSQGHWDQAELKKMVVYSEIFDQPLSMREDIPYI